MQEKRAQELLESAERMRYGTVNRLSAAMAILAKYSNLVGMGGYRFEHDQMWYGAFDEYVAVMSEEDMERMGQLGWFISEESWSLFS